MWLMRFFAAAMLALSPSLTGAQMWPTKPVRFITAFAAGGSSDLVARIIAEQLTASLGKQIVIDNRTGGNGVAGTAIAAKAPPDGYSFLVIFDAHATNPSIQKSLPYDSIRDFTPIMQFASSPYVLMVSAASPYRSVNDLIAAAKAKPGALTLGSSGVGSRGHLAIALLEQRAGFKITQIPYRGPPQALTDVMGGQITMQMGTSLFSMPFVKSQRVRALGISSAARIAQLPDVPTIAEQGFPGYEVNSWWGLLAPRGVPAPILNKLHASLGDVLARPEIRERLEQVGATVRATKPDEFAHYIAAEMKLWGQVVRDNKIGTAE
ncbi:MAG TPA: tripartite tricarboxylate transporter substrate binding protein [Burkholderiales bacterium]|nr:tripartite tricarboxylate transporter substrate binding protein [Burkholderiales bacterium]